MDPHLRINFLLWCDILTHGSRTSELKRVLVYKNIICFWVMLILCGFLILEKNNIILLVCTLPTLLGKQSVINPVNCCSGGFLSWVDIIIIEHCIVILSCWRNHDQGNMIPHNSLQFYSIVVHIMIPFCFRDFFYQHCQNITNSSTNST